MSSFKEKCEKYFGTTNFYEILKIERNVSERELKNAYQKMTFRIRFYGDVSSENSEATEKFNILNKVHSVLHDESKRKIYDDSGTFDEENDSGIDWVAYWRSQFRTLSLIDLQNMEEVYVGSEAEVRDITKAYKDTKGDMTKMLERIKFANIESEPRFIEIVRALVDKGELQEYDQFFKEPLRKRQKRHTKYLREREEFERESISAENMDRRFLELQERTLGNFNDIINRTEANYRISRRSKSIRLGNSSAWKMFQRR